MQNRIHQNILQSTLNNLYSWEETVIDNLLLKTRESEGWEWSGMGLCQSLHNLQNLLKIIDLYTVNGWTVWYVTYTSIKLLKKTAQSSSDFHTNLFQNLFLKKSHFSFNSWVSPSYTHSTLTPHPSVTRETSTCQSAFNLSYMEQDRIEERKLYILRHHPLDKNNGESVDEKLFIYSLFHLLSFFFLNFLKLF